MIFDPLYLLVLLPALLLSFWAQGKVRSAYARGSKIANHRRLTGAEAAHRVLAAAGVRNVDIEMSRGVLSDHYDPRHKVLRLSPDVYNGRSVAALGIAAHEAGHAIQESRGYAPLAIRNGIVPMASVGSGLSFTVFFLGWLFHNPMMIIGAILMFAAFVVFQLVNLPVEFDASRRARLMLAENGLITEAEAPEVRRVLSAAAMTYVAATVGAVLTLIYMLLRSGLLGSRN